MATKKKAPSRKKKSAAPKKKVRKAPARKSVVARGAMPKKVWNRPEVLALSGVVAACAVATSVFLLQRSPHVAPVATSASVAQTTAHLTALSREFARASEMPIADRVVFWSAYVQKQQGGKGELAELVAGRKIADDAPLMPVKFNCTTFVETVAALSHSKSAEDFYGNLIAIRYKNAQPTFAARNHFPELDWIPNNKKAGILQDVTGELARASGVKVLTEKKDFHRAAWLAKQLEKGSVGRGIASEVQTQWKTAVAGQVQFISTRDLEKVLAHVENGSVVNFVHDDNEKKPVLISHQGYLIREGGTVYLRHASSGGEIRQVPLRDYLAGLAKDPAFKKWPIIGINVNRLI